MLDIVLDTETISVNKIFEISALMKHVLIGKDK